MLLQTKTSKQAGGRAAPIQACHSDNFRTRDSSRLIPRRLQNVNARRSSQCTYALYKQTEMSGLCQYVHSQLHQSQLSGPVKPWGTAASFNNEACAGKQATGITSDSVTAASTNATLGKLFLRASRLFVCSFFIFSASLQL